MPSIPKISKPFETFIELLPVVIFDAEPRVDTSDILFSFDEVILLVLSCMVDSVEEDYLLCKTEVDSLIFS